MPMTNAASSDGRRTPRGAEDAQDQNRFRDKKRLYIVDDHAVFREGLRELINGTQELMVCGESSSSEDALQEIPRAKPDVALVDLTLTGMSGMELLKSLTSRYPEVRVLILTMHDETFFAERALRAGAKGYIMKHQAIREVKSAILRILEGGLYVSTQMTEQLIKTVAKVDKGTSFSPVKWLSDREIEVFEMIGRGLGTGEISRALHLGVKTVETYRARIKAKLELKSGSELRQQALKWVYGPRLSGDNVTFPSPIDPTSERRTD